MRAKDCQVVLRLYRVVPSNRIYWQACGVNFAERKHWIQFLVTNEMVTLVHRDKFPSWGMLEFPNEQVYTMFYPQTACCESTKVRIWHPDEYVPNKYNLETLVPYQRTSSYEPHSSSFDAIEGETGEAVDCHMVQTGYVSTYKDRSTNKVTFRVDYRLPIQISLIDWFFRVDKYGNLAQYESYHLQNVIENLRPINVWERLLLQ